MNDYEIDIFIHTWDEFSAMGKPNTERYELNKPLCEKKLTACDIDKIKTLYLPKKILVEKLTVSYGSDISIEKVNCLREKYEEEVNIKYHQILYIRPDILPLHPFIINVFLNIHKKIDRNILHNKYIYCATSVLDRLPIITCDNGFGVGECDLIWFCNFSSKSPIRDNNAIIVPIRYSLNYNFIIWRYLNTDKDKDFFIKLKNSDYKRLYREHSSYAKTISHLELQLQNKTNELKNLQENIAHKKQFLEVQNLEQDVNLKHLKAKEIQENINLKTLKKTKIQKELEQYSNNIVYVERYHQSAKQRIYNHLSYKLGFCAIKNSKTLLGWIVMPITLLGILIAHKQEQKIYQEKIQQNPSLKLPPLESYVDYQEAKKEENSFTYKLGQAIINANKTWYKGGYVRLIFEIR
ncbi:hypothetical protein FUZ02_08790, partial [Campylobacter coli]|nr:hypothetical protein [Campylobacter coli]